MMKKLQQEEKERPGKPGTKKRKQKRSCSFYEVFFATIPTQYLIESISKNLLPSSDGKSIDRSLTSSIRRKYNLTYR